MTDEKKPSPKSIALIQEFFRELQGLQMVIEKGEPFSSLAMDKIADQVSNYSDLPKEFGGLVNTAQKVIEQIKELYASGPDTERLILIQQMFSPFFKIITDCAQQIDGFAKA